jgi:predicted cation transporter
MSIEAIVFLAFAMGLGRILTPRCQPGDTITLYQPGHLIRARGLRWR